METENLSLLISGLFDDCLANVPDEDGEIFCLRVRESELFVGCDAGSRLLAVFLCSDDEINISSSKFSFASRQEITWRDKPSDRQKFGALSLSETSSIEIEHFVEVIVSINQCLQAGMDGNQLARVIESWFGLLMSGDEPTYSAVLGLWGELFVISASRNVRGALTAWQWNDLEPLDFVHRGSAVEVKSTTSSFREHSTSLTQMLAAANLRTVVASVMTQDEIDGTSVYEIYSSLLEAVDGEPLLTAKLVSAFARRVGFSRRIHNWTFSIQKAKETLVFARWADLPKAEFGAGVTSARWSFVLNESQTFPQRQLQSVDRSLGKIF